MKKLLLKNGKRLAKAGAPFSKLHKKYRAAHPKKPDPYFDDRKHAGKYILRLAVTAFAVCLYIETFARIKTGALSGVRFVAEQPLVFAYNWLIIFATLMLCMIFRRRRYVAFLISLVWVLLGTVNGMILIKRMTPFTLYDMQNLKDGLTILTTYYSTPQIVLGSAVLVIGAAIIIIEFIIATKWQNINYKRSVLISASTIALALGATSLLIGNGTLATFFGNLNYAYRDYGFAYCFINTSVNKGISRPDSYSEKSMERILKKTERGSDTLLKQKKDDENYPNVIVLQMESFTRAEDYNHIKVDKDPTPVFNELSRNYTSGWFEVPACGAGTANTEFEVLTGISSKFFGPGEYPYKGKLREETLESMAYVLASHGYTTSAMHDHRALFYNRNEVYANLGFDSYTSIEYMHNISKTPTGWAKDEILTDNIMDIIRTTDTRDFLHVISVEGHGAYPTEQIFKDPYCTVSCDNEEQKWKYEYYLNEMHEMDTFIGDLIDELNASGEPTVMLIYGDHIPALDVTDEEYANGDLYQTRYVIWDNIGLAKEDGDLCAYQSGAELLSKIGMRGEGVMFDYQQSNSPDSKRYKSDMKALAYDMLYGDNFIFGGRDPFKRTDMRMGFSKIEITGIAKIGDDYYIRGKNFTEHSRISMEGELLDTVYLGPTLLGLKSEVDPDDAGKLEVSQIDTKDKTILSTIDFLEEL